MQGKAVSSLCRQLLILLAYSLPALRLSSVIIPEADFFSVVESFALRPCRNVEVGESQGLSPFECRVSSAEQGVSNIRPTNEV